MKRHIILVICLFFIVGMTGSVREVRAEDSEYKHFSQLDKRWNKKSCGSRTIGRSGCMCTSVTTLMAYANPRLRDVKVWNPGIACSKFKYAGASFKSPSVNGADKTFSKYKDVSINKNNGKKEVRKYYNKGYYVIVCAGPPIASSTTHWCAIVGWDKDKDEPLVMDPAGGKHPKWSQWEPYLKDMDVYKSTLNKSYDVMSGTGIERSENDGKQENAPKNAEEERKLDKLIDEWKLEGMSEAPIMASKQEEVEIVGIESLSKEEQSKVADIKTDMTKNTKNAIDIFHIVTMAVGIGLILYGVLLCFAYLFDYINVFVEISLLGVLSFGKFRILEDEAFDRGSGIRGGYDQVKEVTYLSRGMLFKRSGLCIALGLFLVSGIMYSWISNIMLWVAEMLGR